MNTEDEGRKLKDQIQDTLNNVCLKNGMDALWAAVHGPEEWAKTPSQEIPAKTALMLAKISKLAGADPNSESEKILNRSWMETDRELAKEYIDYVFDQFALWAMTERPDLLRTGRQMINDSLDPEDQI